MADPPLYPDSNDGTGVGTGSKATRGRGRWVKVFGIILVKIGIIAFILILFRGLRIPLMAGHGVALLVLLVAAAVTLSVYKLRGVTLPPALRRRPSLGHGFVPRLRSKILARVLKNKVGK